MLEQPPGTLRILLANARLGDLYCFLVSELRRILSLQKGDLRKLLSQVESAQERSIRLLYL